MLVQLGSYLSKNAYIENPYTPNQDVKICGGVRERDTEE